MKICPRCNSENIEEASYCHTCGFELEKKFVNNNVKKKVKIKDENLALILFYKYDEKNQEYSISKTKIITIFLSLVTFAVAVNNTVLSTSYFKPADLWLSIIFTLILGSIIYLIGLLLRYIINKIS